LRFTTLLYKSNASFTSWSTTKTWRLVIRLTERGYPIVLQFITSRETQMWFFGIGWSCSHLQHQPSSPIFRPKAGLRITVFEYSLSKVW
jgi:hypothetical protein